MAAETETLLMAALTYAAKGWPVLPLHTWTGQRCTCDHPDDCGSPAKHPRTRNGLKDASTDSQKIRSWWGRWPDANIGLRTGVAFDAIDIDGETGFDSVARMNQAHGNVPAGPISFTGGGGAHSLYLPTGVGNRAGILDHVDWRGKNGYIVAPPSLHASGNYYRWEENPGDPIMVEGWLKDLLFPPKPPPGLAVFPAPKVRDAGTYGRRAFDAELGELARAREGERNNQLNTSAFNLYQLVRGVELDHGEVTDALTRVAIGTGLTDREIKATLGSAWNATHGQARSAPVFTVVGSNALTQPSPILEDNPEEPQQEEEPARRDSKHDFELVEFLHQPEPEYDWLIPGIAERGDRIIVTGPEGGGKSTLLQQIYMLTAAGIHPFTLDEIDPRRVLLIDLENGRRHLRRKLRPLWIATKNGIPEGHARVISLPSGIDLCNPEHSRWLRGRFAADRPEIVCIGPIYKMGNGDPIKEETAKQISSALDNLRTDFECCFFIEAHQAYGQNGTRPERPYGASLWSRWPEFGLHLSATGNLRHWRGDRDERAWPSTLQKGGAWPWTVVPGAQQPSDDNKECVAAILALLAANPTLEYSKRQLDDALKATGKSYQRQILFHTVDRLITDSVVAARTGPRSSHLICHKENDGEELF